MWAELENNQGFINLIQVDYLKPVSVSGQWQVEVGVFNVSSPSTTLRLSGTHVDQAAAHQFIKELVPD